MSEGELVNFIRGLNYSENWENQITNYDYKEIDDFITLTVTAMKKELIKPFASIRV